MFRGDSMILSFYVPYKSAGRGYVISIGYKVGRVFPMVVFSIQPHAEFGPTDHQKDAPRFSSELLRKI